MLVLWARESSSGIRIPQTSFFGKRIKSYFSTSTGAGSWNFIHYSNAKVDELFQQQLLLSDPEERAACFHEIAELISEDVPWIPLYNKAGLIGLSNRVQDYVCDFRGAFFQIEKWNIAE